MTTEVGSASEVKKESDQLGADATKEKPKEVAENQQNQTSDPEEEKGSQSSPPAESQSSPRRQKKEKDPSESRGISRFIPPWLKKQKSYTLVVAKDGGDKKEPTQLVVEEQVLDKEESLPEEERQGPHLRRLQGLPWWCTGQESACQCRGKIPSLGGSHMPRGS